MDYMDELIVERFSFMVDEYGFEYKFRKFDLGGGFHPSSHSYVNSSGCFTIHSMVCRGELSFYYSSEFSEDRKRLHEKEINIYTIEPQIWDKYGKIGFLPNIFFWWSYKNIAKTAAEVVKTCFEKYGEFCGIKIDKQEKDN